MNQKKSRKNKIVIIGSGNVGQSLAQLMINNGFTVELIDRDSKRQRAACRESDIVLLTVPDSIIETLCTKLRDYFKPAAVIGHCSGALPSSVLKSAKRKGCFIASLHPLNTFPSLQASLSLLSNTSHGTYLYSEGDTQALTIAEPIFQELGFHTTGLPAGTKTAYHLACVFASNYLTVLMDLSMQSATAAGIDKQQFWRSVQPLMQSTLGNLANTDANTALSGPIARGDITTIEQHISQLKEYSDKSSIENSIEPDANSLNCYLALGQHALNLTKQRGELSDEKLAQLESVLK